jgi:hypothetical protein
MKTREFGKNNLGAIHLKLSDEEIIQINEASAKIKILGERYPEAAQRMIDR